MRFVALCTVVIAVLSLAIYGISAYPVGTFEQTSQVNQGKNENIFSGEAIPVNVLRSILKAASPYGSGAASSGSSSASSSSSSSSSSAASGASSAASGVSSSASSLSSAFYSNALFNAIADFSNTLRGAGGDSKI